MRRFLRLLSSILGKLTQLPDWLDWLLSVVEPAVVLAVTSVILYIVYWLVFGPEQDPRQARFRELIKGVSDNWKAGLVLLIILFYRTIRIFLEQAEEALGVKRPLTGEAQEGSKASTQERV